MGGDQDTLHISLCTFLQLCHHHATLFFQSVEQASDLFFTLEGKSIVLSEKVLKTII